MITMDKNCTACGACVQKCPKACITMQEDENGFLFPKVDKEKCVGCGLCEKVCHLNINASNDKTKTAVACVHRSEEVLKRSTSGGAFSAIAERIFACKGIVYGCGYVTPTQPQHIRIERQDDMKKLRGSKYVQSTIENAYRQVFDDLRADKLVFFTGTPCQVAGLKAFLGKPYDNLITADIICHGVPSAAYFKKFVDWYEEKHQCKVIDFDFVTTDDFVKGNDGYFYLNGELAPGNKVTFSNFIVVPDEAIFESSKKYILSIIVENLDATLDVDNIWQFQEENV